MLSISDLRMEVIRPTLEHLNLWSPAAENLVLGTALEESDLVHLRQVNGPARGLWQMEPATCVDILENFVKPRHDLEHLLMQLAAWRPMPLAMQLAGNLNLACAMCRIHYRRVPAPLPAADDIKGLAAYWKLYYNTPLGKGSADGWEHGYRTRVLGEKR